MQDFKVVQTIMTDKEEYRGCLTIEMEGKKVFVVCDGEPEDNSLGRNFSDCYNILDIIDEAHKAGIDGRTLVIEKLEKDWE